MVRDPAPEPVHGVLFGVDEVTVTGRPWVRLWVASGETREAIWLPDAEPAMFLLPALGVDAASVVAEARARGLSAAVLEKRVGRDVRTVVRVVARHPGDLPDLRRGFEDLADVDAVREASIAFEERTLFERQLRSMDGVEGEARRDPRVEGRVATRLVAGPAPSVAWRRAALAATFSPDSEAALLRVSFLPEGGPATSRVVANVEGEREALRALADAFLASDPDVLLTWNGDVGIFPALVSRAAALGVRLGFGRDGSEPEVGGAGPNRVARITGRAHVDLRRVADRDLRFDVKVKTLPTVGDHLGVEVDEESESDPDAASAATLAVGLALLPLQEAFARLTRLPLEEASRAGRGRQVEALLLGEASRLGILAPERGSEEAADDVYEGGFVLEPSPGLHEDVVALDFGAMYPSLMIAYNVSPDTLLSAEEAGDAHVAPEVGHRFLREPDGFLRRILRDLVARRRAIQRRMRSLPAGPERAALDVEQSSIKVLANAVYGYTGWAQARWGCRACAEATAAYGRDHIRWVMDEARARGLRVLYSDTDSLFLEAPGDVAPFVAHVNANLPLELDVAERYDVLLFTGAKKRYAGIADDGRLVARGFEIRRGDWCAYARRLQEKVLDTLLRERDKEKALASAREAIARLRAGEVPAEDLVVWKTLTARPETYRSKPFHAAAVERGEAAKPGLSVPVGTKVGILMVAGSGGAHERATLREIAAGKPLDLEWYVEKQAVPAAVRVLETVGIGEDEVKGKPRQKSLGEFF